MKRILALLLSLCILCVGGGGGCSKPAPKSLVVNRSEEPYDYTGNEVAGGGDEGDINIPHGEIPHTPPPETNPGNQGGSDKKDLVKWVTDKFWGAFKNPYCSNFSHLNQWDWRHGVTALAGVALLSYGGYKAYNYGSDVVRTKRAIYQVTDAYGVLADIASDMILIKQEQTDETTIVDKDGVPFCLYPIKMIGDLGNEIQNLEEVVLKYVPLLPKPYPQAIKSFIENGFIEDGEKYIYPMLKGKKEVLRVRMESAIYEGCKDNKCLLKSYIKPLKTDDVFLSRYVQHPFILQSTVIPNYFDENTPLNRRKDYVLEIINPTYNRLNRLNLEK